MTERLALEREAMRSALQLRRSRSIAREDAVNVYDIADAIGVTVRFADRPSLEGMFFRGPHPIIVLPSLHHRPHGRVTFTCAHELGHFALGHGTRVDKYITDEIQTERKPDEEIAADTFASSLLMPRPAVLHRFRLRAWDPATASPLQLFMVAGELDVGYETLLKHLTYNLRLVDETWLRRRQQTTPKLLRSRILGNHTARRVVLVDDLWPDIPLDIEVGECVALPKHLEVDTSGPLSDIGVNDPWRLLTALRPGRTRIDVQGRFLDVRVARYGYCGDLKYRFLEDPEAI